MPSNRTVDASQGNLMFSHIKLISLFLAVLVLPIVPLFLLSSLAVVTSTRKGYRLFFLCSLLLLFIMLNTTRSVDGDLQNYLAIYDYLSENSLASFFAGAGASAGVNKFLVSFRLSEAVWYAITWAIANLSNGSQFVYIALLTVLIYGIYYSGIKIILREIEADRLGYLLIIAFAMLVCINFSETSHLLRQYICGSVLFVQFLLLMQKKFFAFFLLMLPAVFIHNSLVIPALIAWVAYFLSNQHIIRLKVLKVLVIPLVLGLIIGKLLSNIIIMYNYEVSKGGDAVFISMALDVLLFLLAAFYYFFVAGESRFRKWVECYLIFTITIAPCLYFLKDNMILYLRFYLYLEWFRIFGFICLLMMAGSLRKSGLVNLCVVFLCFVFFMLRISRASWEYGIGISDLFLKNIIQLLIPYI